MSDIATTAYRVHLDSETLPERFGGGSLSESIDSFAAAVESSPLLAAPVISGDTLLRRLSLTASASAEGPGQALTVAQAAFLWGLQQIGAGGTRIAEATVEAERPDPADRDDLVDRQELVSTPQVAERLKLTRQRIIQYVGEKGRFPVPVTRVRGTAVWRWGDIVDWIDAGHWKKAPGRPKNVEELNDVELFLLALPTPLPSEIGRRARAEMGRRGFAGWESALQQGERWARGELPRSFSEVLDKVDVEILKKVAANPQLDPMDLASEKLLARGYRYRDGQWVEEAEPVATMAASAEPGPRRASVTSTRSSTSRSSAY